MTPDETVPISTWDIRDRAERKKPQRFAEAACQFSELASRRPFQGLPRIDRERHSLFCRYRLKQNVGHHGARRVGHPLREKPQAPLRVHTDQALSA